ncbi:hypothetical protein AX14_007675 [Amanita brunnescens Koide BX004]|nr:hypothetical protein AX14_007675 [Amanita brunnescens Koide BX004]
MAASLFTPPDSASSSTPEIHTHAPLTPTTATLKLPPPLKSFVHGGSAEAPTSPLPTSTKKTQSTSTPPSNRPATRTEPYYTPPLKNGAISTFTSHTAERREGVGGIFFDDLHDGEHKRMPASTGAPDRPQPAVEIFAFVQSAGQLRSSLSTSPSCPSATPSPTPITTAAGNSSAAADKSNSTSSSTAAPNSA